jgi:hypothetical protein
MDRERYIFNNNNSNNNIKSRKRTGKPRINRNRNRNKYRKTDIILNSVNYIEINYHNNKFINKINLKENFQKIKENYNFDIFDIEMMNIYNYSKNDIILNSLNIFEFQKYMNII